MEFQIEAIKPDLFEGREVYQVHLIGKISKNGLGELFRASKFNVVDVLPVPTPPPPPKKEEVSDGSGEYDQ